MTKNAWILVIILIYLIGAGAVISYLSFYTGFSDWLALSALVISGVIATERIAEGLSNLFKEPRLKVVGSRKDLQYEGSAGEFLDIYLLVKNIGGARAEDCDIQAMVKGVTKNLYFVNLEYISLNPKITKEIPFQRIVKTARKTQVSTKGSPELELGRIYEFKLTFSGANLEEIRNQTLKLDLSSWEKIKVLLDC